MMTTKRHATNYFDVHSIHRREKQNVIKVIVAKKSTWHFVVMTSCLIIVDFFCFYDDLFFQQKEIY